MSEKKVSKHTIDSLREAIKEKKLDYCLEAVSVDSLLSTARVMDKTYGQYSIDLKALAPSSKIPLHPFRKRQNRLTALKAKYEGKEYRGLKILNIFYGPDRGYKNRSFYCEYVGLCGHTITNSPTLVFVYKKGEKCQACGTTQHGERKRNNGVLKKRSITYIHWQRLKKTLPDKYQNFALFKEDAGEKPVKRADLKFVDGRPTWVCVDVDSDAEVNAIATAVRQAFRYSIIYREALAEARVETPEGPRYRCAACQGLSRRTRVEVDHVDPIMPIDGSPLERHTVVDRVWTKKVQILDKTCHTRKSSQENALRRKHKKENKR